MNDRICADHNLLFYRVLFFKGTFFCYGVIQSSLVYLPIQFPTKKVTHANRSFDRTNALRYGHTRSPVLILCNDRGRREERRGRTDDATIASHGRKENELAICVGRGRCQLRRGRQFNSSLFLYKIVSTCVCTILGDIDVGNSRLVIVVISS